MDAPEPLAKVRPQKSSYLAPLKTFITSAPTARVSRLSRDEGGPARTYALPRSPRGPDHGASLESEGIQHRSAGRIGSRALHKQPQPGPASAMLDARIARHPGIAARYESGQRESAVLGTAPEDNYVRIPCGEGWALVGDAGMHQDPWSGRGIDMAAVQAATLADELTPALQGGGDLTDALARYRARRDEHGLDSWRNAVTLADDLTQLTVRDTPGGPNPP